MVPTLMSVANKEENKIKFKIKFKCNECGKFFYDYATLKSRKQAKRYKESFKEYTSSLHDLVEGCVCRN